MRYALCWPERATFTAHNRASSYAASALRYAFFYYSDCSFGLHDTVHLSLLLTRVSFILAVHEIS